MERTLSIIKPDATKRSITGKINAIIEEVGLSIIAQKRITLSEAQAQEFYGVHKEKPFFRDLVNFITSGPVVVQVLEAENAIALYRKTMGATGHCRSIQHVISALQVDLHDRAIHHGSPVDLAAVPHTLHPHGKNCAVFHGRRNGFGAHGGRAEG